MTERAYLLAMSSKMAAVQDRKMTSLSKAYTKARISLKSEQANLKARATQAKQYRAKMQHFYRCANDEQEKIHAAPSARSPTFALAKAYTALSAHKSAAKRYAKDYERAVLQLVRSKASFFCVLQSTSWRLLTRKKNHIRTPCRKPSRGSTRSSKAWKTTWCSNRTSAAQPTTA